MSVQAIKQREYALNLDKEVEMMQTKPIAIEVKNLSITYKSLKAYSIKRNLLKLKKVDVKKFKAVNNVSFTVEEGHILGIIGKNGSGKSQRKHIFPSMKEQSIYIINPYLCYQ